MERRAAPVSEEVVTTNLLKAYPTTWGDPHELVDADYNPRTIDPDQLDALCASIYEFGCVEPFVARAEDKLIVGGHQRKVALLHLLSGEWTRVDKETGKRVKVTDFKLPAEGVPIVFVPGLSDERAKVLNLALNRISGDWDHTKLSKLFKSFGDDLAEGGFKLSDGLDLRTSGFTGPEIVDYLDMQSGLTGDGTGDMPRPSTKAPSLSLDFSSKELRDAVKSAIAATSKDEQALSGDLLAKMLGVKKGRKASGSAS